MSSGTWSALPSEASSCARPSSSSRKSSRVKPCTASPFASTTETGTTTRFEVTRTTSSSSSSASPGFASGVGRGRRPLLLRRLLLRRGRRRRLRPLRGRQLRDDDGRRLRRRGGLREGRRDPARARAARLRAHESGGQQRREQAEHDEESGGPLETSLRISQACIPSHKLWLRPRRACPPVTVYARCVWMPRGCPLVGAEARASRRNVTGGGKREPSRRLLLSVFERAGLTRGCPCWAGSSRARSG